MKDCTICGHLLSGSQQFYNVSCCNACKQFFHRAVAQKREYRCTNSYKCHSSKGLKCPSCRFDQCLLVGMNPTQIKAREPGPLEQHSRSKYLAYLVERRKGAAEKRMKQSERMMSEGKKMPKKLAQNNDKTAQIFRTLEELMGVEKKIRNLMNRRDEVMLDEFLGQFDTLGKLLESGDTVLDKIDKYTNQKRPAIIKQYRGEMNNTYGEKFRGKPYLVMNELICVVDFFRSMPIFAKLDPKDRVILLNYTGIALKELSLRFTSSQRNSPIVVYPDSEFSPYFMYSDSYYSRDPNLCQMGEYVFRRSMEPFNQSKLTMEEFLLLRAIILNHSAIDELSPEGKQLVQLESECYANYLLHIAQMRHGVSLGARRFAELMHLAEVMFSVNHRFHELCTYKAMITHQGVYHSYMSSMRLFLPMLLHGKN